MSGVQVVRVGTTSSSTVVRVEALGSSNVVIPVSGGSGPRTGERWWQGEGPPPEFISGVRVGDWYWDVVSGDVYELTEGL